jgi:hypothetical protein
LTSNTEINEIKGIRAATLLGLFFAFFALLALFVPERFLQLRVSKIITLALAALSGFFE